MRRRDLLKSIVPFGLVFTGCATQEPKKIPPTETIIVDWIKKQEAEVVRLMERMLSSYLSDYKKYMKLDITEKVVEEELRKSSKHFEHKVRIQKVVYQWIAPSRLTGIVNVDCDLLLDAFVINDNPICISFVWEIEE